MVGKRPLRGASSRADLAHGRSLITGPEHQAHAGSQYFAAERRPTHRQVERIIRTYVLKSQSDIFYRDGTPVGQPSEVRTCPNRTSNIARGEPGTQQLRNFWIVLELRIKLVTGDASRVPREAIRVRR